MTTDNHAAEILSIRASLSKHAFTANALDALGMERVADRLESLAAQLSSPGATTNPEIEILNNDPIALAVFGHWMETGEPATIADIAAWTTWSPAKVRRSIAKYPGSDIPRCVFTESSVPVRESNYGTVTHHRRVDAWEPDRRTMRAVITAQRQTIGRLSRKCGESHPELSPRDYAETQCP